MHGLFLEGARTENRCLERSFPKVLVEPLPILSIQPIEAHRLKLQVCCVPFSMITIQYIVLCSINASTHSITCLKWPPSISLTFTFPLHLISYDFMCVYFMKSIEQKCLADFCATPILSYLYLYRYFHHLIQITYKSSWHFHSFDLFSCLPYPKGT